MLFAIATDGTIYAYDTTLGNPQPVFVNNTTSCRDGDFERQRFGVLEPGSQLVASDG
jgi:hypothetical protein